MTGGAVEIRGAIGKAADRGGAGFDLAGSRQGHPRIAIAIALALAAGVWGVATLAPQHTGLPALLGLGAAALVGLVFSLGVVAGFVHIGRLPRQRVFFDGLVDAVADPCVVTDRRGRVVYTNEPYRQLLSAVGLSRLIGVENLYAGYPDVADKVYRLSQTAREGKAAHEEFRLSPGSAAALARRDKPAWIRAQIRPVGLPAGQLYTLWRLIDLTDDRARQEEAFGHLQYIINYLDHAPAGFFSTAPSGQIVYVNATLAGWLDIDLDRDDRRHADARAARHPRRGAPHRQDRAGAGRRQGGELRPRSAGPGRQADPGPHHPPHRFQQRRPAAAVALAGARPAGPRSRAGERRRRQDRPPLQQCADRHRPDRPRRPDPVDATPPSSRWRRWRGSAARSPCRSPKSIAPPSPTPWRRRSAARSRSPSTLPLPASRSAPASCFSAGSIKAAPRRSPSMPPTRREHKSLEVQLAPEPEDAGDRPAGRRRRA